MITKFKNFAQKHQVLTFWLLAILFAIIIIPAALLVFTSFPNFGKDIMEVTDGKGYNTNILYSLPIALKVSGGALFALILLAWPATSSISAIITSLILKGKQGVKELFGRFRFWAPEISFKKGISIWLQAILLIAVIKLVYSVSLNIAGGIPISESFTINTNYTFGEIIFIFITCLLFDGGGLMEELGWRGFALPRLQKKYNPLTASIILGTIWSLWHVPIKLDVLSSFTNFAVFYLDFTFVAILYSIIITYFYNKLGGSVLIGIAIHGLYNDSTGLAGIFNSGSLDMSDTIESLIYAGIFLVVVIFILIKEGKMLGFKEERDSEQKLEISNTELVT